MSSEPPAASSTFGEAKFSKEEHEAIENALKKRLGPNYLSTRPAMGGQKVVYIEGWRLIDIANGIFGFNGWSHSVTSTSVDFIDHFNVRQNFLMKSKQVKNSRQMKRSQILFLKFSREITTVNKSKLKKMYHYSQNSTWASLPLYGYSFATGPFTKMLDMESVRA